MKTSFHGLCMLCMLPVIIAGCSSNQPAQPVTEATIAAPKEDGQIELSDPQFVMTPPNIVHFEMKYKFVKGRPDKSYLCTISFPGTTNTGQKPIEAWELKESGVIKGALEMQSLDTPVEKFEIHMGESENPQSGFTTISNTLTGEVQGLK